MAIYINDKVADSLLAKVMELSGKTNKTQTVIDVLRQEVSKLEEIKPPSQRIECYQNAYAALCSAD